MSSQSFAELGVSRPVVAALAARGIEQPFAIQRLVVADALAGRDVLAKSPTGTGKTLAFGLPLVDSIEANDRRPAALVLAPTRELATQIVDELHDVAHARALKVKAVYGGVGLEKQAREAARAHIVVATPGRLEDLLARRAFTLDQVRILVLDEADRMLDMGFRPAVDRIVGQCPADRQTLFFSATLDGDAGRIAEAYTTDPARHEFTPKPQRAADIEHRFVAVTHEERVDALLAELRRERDLALVFVRTKRGADRLVKRLGHQGIDAVAMHGDKSQRQREKALARFERGDVDTLVATDVAARGIDIDGISHVIQFDPPEDREGYVHRVGRTGRAGRTGIGITFVKDDQAADVAKIAGELKLQREFERSGLRSNATAGARTPRRRTRQRSRAR
ncbi:MAG TPA: DEAD/DEAH box helicase [Capillimicrobium sp.]|nr:DEAD/DEAH box helicase [Capillimicrobium sp.]